MAISKTSGALAISEIVTEYGDAAGGSDSMSEYYGDGQNVPDGTADGDGANPGGCNAISGPRLLQAGTGRAVAAESATLGDSDSISMSAAI